MIHAAAALADRVMTPLGTWVDERDMARLGIASSMRLAKGYNLLRRGHHLRYRRALYRHRFDELLAGNGAHTVAPNAMRDGWALDTSASLPHLDRLLAAGDAIIAERGGAPRALSPKGFLQDILLPKHFERFPAILDFALSSEVLATVGRYLGFVPALSRTMPPAARLVESSRAFDSLAGAPPRESQLHHRDHHDLPLVYLIVLLRDVDERTGPFSFLPAAASARATRALGYGRRGAPYRVTDEAMYAVVPRDELQVLAYPRGTVLFVDSSRCFHYGSRDAWTTRYQMMYAYVSPCRTDFSELHMRPRYYAARQGDSPLARLVLHPCGRL